MIKVIVISDIKIYCDGLDKILSDTHPIKVVGAENNFLSAIDRLQAAQPDVVLLDMTMLGSCHFAQEVSQLRPEIKIVALAVPEDEENIMECAEAGIAGYVAREASLDDLIETVIGTQNGDFYCPPKIAACIFKTIKRIKQNAKVQRLPPVVRNNCENLTAVLTRREQQIYNLMLEGLSNKKISHHLVIEVSTVKNHVHNILVKLDVKSRAQAVMLTQRNSLFNTPDRGISASSLS
jgi:two-component system, NarL family, nitrate/nitrite response regulator NarL